MTACAVLAAAALDSQLAGLIILGDPVAANVSPAWCATQRWERAVRVLVRHRDAGSHLGSILVAGDVLAAAGTPYPRTTAAEAVVASVEQVPVAVVAAGRARFVWLEAQRVAGLLADAAHAEPAGLLWALEEARPRVDLLLVQARELMASIGSNE